VLAAQLRPASFNESCMYSGVVIKANCPSMNRHNDSSCCFPSMMSHTPYHLLLVENQTCESKSSVHRTRLDRVNQQLPLLKSPHITLRW